MAQPRKKIPRAVETQLLTLSKRRCCICFFLQSDDTRKDGQIAHLDHNRDNNKLDNLAWLCLEHHNEYDSKTSQAKGLTKAEVKRHREALYGYYQTEEERRWQDVGDSLDPRDAWKPDSINERLWTNLLEVRKVPERIWVAGTEFRKPKLLWEAIRGRSARRIEAPVLLSEGKITTFQDLREFPWSDVCDLGTCEDFETEEWSQSEDEQRLRDFVQLLKRCLKEMLWPTVIFNKKKDYYHFRATDDMGPRVFKYRSRSQNTSATVFKGYPKKTKPGTAFFRHAAVDVTFRRLGEQWYVALSPTFHFTHDGQREDKFGAERLSKKKRLDHNSSVAGQTIMWAEYLKSLYKPLYAEPFDLEFGELATLEADFGIDEGLWQAPDENLGSESGSGDLWDL